MAGRVYRYRRHIQWGQYLVAMLVGVMGFSLAVLYISLFLMDVAESGLLTIVFPIIALVLLLGGGGTIWYMFYRMAGTTVSIEEGSVIHTTRSGKSKLPIEEITCLEFPSIKYTGGWLKIITPERNIRLTVVIEGIGELLLELQKSLDERGLSDRYDRAKLFQFLKTATYSDQSWNRVYRIFWKLILATAFCCFVGIIGMTVANNALLGMLLLQVSMLWPVIFYLGAEAILGRAFAKATDEERFYCPAPDIELERKVFRKASYIGVTLYVVGLAAVSLAQI